MAFVGRHGEGFDFIRKVWYLRLLAEHSLQGVGDATREFREYTGYAFHLRRRLSVEEEALIGPAVDCRGTSEWHQRFNAIQGVLPERARALALEECGNA